jgi:hypothetical protein
MIFTKRLNELNFKLVNIAPSYTHVNDMILISLPWMAIGSYPESIHLARFKKALYKKGGNNESILIENATKVLKLSYHDIYALAACRVTFEDDEDWIRAIELLEGV